MQMAKVKRQKYGRLKSLNLLLPFGFLLLTFSGCATAPLEPLPKASPAMPGIYHRVERGQTLWRISKTYDIDIDELVKANRIADTSKIETGQMIFIPRKPGVKPQSARPLILDEDFGWPVKGKIIAGYGQMRENAVNKGIDIQAPENARVFASRSGKVVFAGLTNGKFGKTIVIDHGDGYSSLYARNAQLLVRPGDEVVKGSSIAKIGSSGRDKAKYLHFEIRKGYLPQNPGFYLP